MSKLTRILTIAISAVLILAILSGGFGLYTVRRSFPQVDGQITVPGLQSRVEVYRDAIGVPHIYADSTHDLFFAQGYVHAQERFWQMDFWRHIGTGRLSEMFGPASLDSDLFLRTLGWTRIAETEWEQMDPDSRVILQAFADGVNAYLADHQGAALSLEYAILGLTNKHYAPGPWTPAHTLVWAKVMSWDLGGNMSSEMRRAELLNLVGPERTAELMPPYPYGLNPQILPHPAVGVLPARQSGKTSGVFEDPGGLALPAGDLPAGTYTALLDQVAAVNALSGGGQSGLGSNNWVVAGSRSETGLPILANDPHLSIQMPSIWFEVGLHCNNPSAACPFDVTGFAFSAAPGVIIGHNNRIAWGVTNVGPDVQDLFIEKINPQNPHQYEVNGEWVDMEVSHETILVAGKIEPDPDEPDRDLGTYDPVAGITRLDLEIRRTRHGPIISETHSGARKLGERAGEVLDLPENYAIALQWTALQPISTFRAIWKLDRAENFDQFREALRDWDAPSQNIIYADVDGNIGYQMPGRVPIRAAGDGALPVPGWTDRYEWTGFVPFEELPYSYNPPQGYIATANQAVVGPDYPYFISQDWDLGYRANRINELLQARKLHSLDSLAAIQGDNFNAGAEIIVPYLTALAFDDPQQADAVQRLANWDRQDRMDSNPAAIFNAFWLALQRATFADELPYRHYPGGGSHWFWIFDGLLQDPRSAWWDDVNTPGVETRDEVLRRALAEGLELLADVYGDDMNDWTWGALHLANFRNATLGESGIGPIEALFNRGPFPVSGGSAIINATGWNWKSGFTDEDETENSDHPQAFDARRAFQVLSLPSMRMLVDLRALDNSQTMHTTGQSGHAYHPHYIDMADLWRNIQYQPMLFSREAVEAAAASRLTLTP